MRLFNRQIEPEAFRNKQVFAGLFLSRFDQQGLRALGFASFTEAFNVIGYALGGRPASIKNYRDEFDPYYSTKRKGWHKRSMREYCRMVASEYADLSLVEATSLLKSIIYEGGALDALAADVPDVEAGSFAKRLITGQAAEKYFELVHPTLSKLADYPLENVTNVGCGFDFRLKKPRENDFLAVEVKGLNSARGTVSLTDKEHRVAGLLAQRYYLFVVKNFKESPSHNIYQDPLNSNLTITRQEVPVIQVNWRLCV